MNKNNQQTSQKLLSTNQLQIYKPNKNIKIRFINNPNFPKHFINKDTTL